MYLLGVIINTAETGPQYVLRHAHSHGLVNSTLLPASISCKKRLRLVRIRGVHEEAGESSLMGLDKLTSHESKPQVQRHSG